MAIYTVTISEPTIFFGEGEVGGATPYHEVIIDSFTFTETVHPFGTYEQRISEFVRVSEVSRIHDLPWYATVQDTFQFQENLKYDWGIANISIIEKPLHVTEKMILTMPVHQFTVTETLTLMEFVGKVTTISITDTVTFTIAAFQSKDKNNSETITIVETYIQAKSKGMNQFVPVYEYLCMKNIFNRSVTENLPFTDYLTRYGSRGNTGINNPVFVGYNDLTNAQYNNLTNDQYNNLLTTTPTDDTGSVNFPFVYYGDMTDELGVFESQGRIGGHALCD